MGFSLDPLGFRETQMSFSHLFRKVKEWSKKFEDINFVWLARNGNQPADLLSKSPIQGNGKYMFHSLITAVITNVNDVSNYVC
ncbi:hypothetical protein EUTSA_v10005431mg [Eutrema salsugineum]|uniref:RNase H type-1 domain-containing protein n=1 Tax=Eutrema salsugineum TaxID=72664 RepID=V4KXE5_EUTSA|nr:hypothetical protein EUTSA_v10005431mg [Eutrema salsugineum]